MDSGNPEAIIVLTDKPNVDVVLESVEELKEDIPIDAKTLNVLLQHCKKVRVISETIFKTLPEFQHNFGIPPSPPLGDPNDGQ